MINIDEVVAKGTLCPGPWLLPEYHHHQVFMWSREEIYDLVLGEMLTGFITFFLGRTNP